MTPEAQRIAIAEACGLHPNNYEESHGVWTSAEIACTPDYINDLNAMHEAEKAITDWWAYSDHLNEITDSSCFRYQQGLIHATAAQRAEAFLRCEHSDFGNDSHPND